MRPSACIVCEAPVEPVLDLGVQPPANTLLASPGDAYESYPLGLSACASCTHGQLSDFVDPKTLFVDYLYASGTSNTLRRYFAWLASKLAPVVPQEGRVLEIGSNDGSFLSALREAGITAVGVDPAKELNEVARQKGHDVMTGFFPSDAPPGEFDLIVGMNVAAHTPDPVNFMRGIRAALTPNGVALIQTSQARMIENAEFDTIYHEHYSFFTLESMRVLAARTGLRLEAVHLASIHGTSFAFVLRRMESRSVPAPLEWEGDFACSGSTAECVRSSWSEFSKAARVVMDDVSRSIAHHQGEGRDIALVGVAAKALTLIRAVGVQPSAFFDEAALKIGRYVPGYAFPIQALEEVGGLSRDTLFVLGAWNFADELIAKIVQRPLKITPRFLTYYPTLTEIDASVA